MKIRPALTLSLTRDRDDTEPDQPERETQLDAWVSDAPGQHDAPRIGFTSIEREDA